MNNYKFTYWDLFIPVIGIGATVIMLIAGASEDISYAIALTSFL